MNTNLIKSIQNLKLSKLVSLKLINKINHLDDVNIPKVSYKKEDLDNFYKWFVGFVDGEGSFKASFRKIINLEHSRIIFSLSIYLHYKDKKVLEFIKNTLKLDNTIHNINRSDGTKRCELTISNKKVLSEKFIPIFTKYQLSTKKYHDFNIWLKMFKLYENKDILFKDKYDELLVLKSKLNNYEYKHDDNKLDIKINIPWYIGFMEGEGSYSLKYNSNFYKFALISELSQREESIKLFNFLLIWLHDLSPDINCPSFLKDFLNHKVKFNLKSYPKNNKIKITLSSIDYFYWVYFPNIIHYNWNSRKEVNMTLFLIATIILKHGLHLHKDGFHLLIKIFNYINLYYPPYSISSFKNDIFKVLALPPIYNPLHSQDFNGRTIGRKLKSKFISFL